MSTTPISAGLPQLCLRAAHPQAGDKEPDFEDFQNKNPEL